MRKNGKKLLSLVLALVMVVGLLPAAALAAEEDKTVELSAWQDGTFNNGVYEGYYAQLNTTQKILYNKIKEAFAEPVTEATIEFDEPIILRSENGGSFTEDDKYRWMCDNMYNQYGGRYAVFRDHPERPWLLAVDYGARTLGEWIYNDQGVSIGYRMTGMFYENTYPWVPPEAYTNPSALEKGVDDAVAAIGAGRSSRAATVRAILEYLCKMTTYETRTGTMPDKNGGEAHTVYYDHTSYSVLAEPHTGVCNAYAAAFKLLCDRYGIPCVHLSGATSAGNHAWNYVLLEDNCWYAVDPTWSDGSTIDYSYFLAGKDTFGASHEVPAGNDGLACPPLSNTEYPYLEAKLDNVPETIEPGESIQLSLSEVRDLNGTVINNVNVGLFADGSERAAAVGRIKNGSVDLHYDTVESNLEPGSHSLYIKCENGKQKNAILAAVVVTVQSAESVTPQPEFTDVPTDSWYYDAVYWAVEKEITIGTSETTFTPDRTCTEVEILTFLWRAAGEPGSTAQLPFTPKNSWAADALRWAHEKGMIDASFSESNPCTRSTAAKFIWQAAGSPATAAANSFTDVPAGADYVTAVAWAVEQKVTQGTGDGTTFSPNKSCTRAEIVTLLHRAYK